MLGLRHRIAKKKRSEHLNLLSVDPHILRIRNLESASKNVADPKNLDSAPKLSIMYNVNNMHISEI